MPEAVVELPLNLKSLTGSLGDSSKQNFPKLLQN